MQVIADLQLHSRFARAVSKQMTIPYIADWARRKGIGLVATGDWTHPLWFREIERDLEEVGSGLLRLKTKEESPLFLLATEVSSIYSQGGRLRRVHTLIWVPTIAAARKINSEFTKRGCNLMSDGRPIIGLSSIHVAELVLTVEPKALVIPAHCLLPEERVVVSGFVPKAIRDIQQGAKVLTHKGVFESVTEVKKRNYSGKIITIQPWYFRPGLTTTPEHPYLAVKTIKKCPSTGDICRPSKAHLRVCRSNDCLSYTTAWIRAQDLEIGDVLVYPRPKKLRVSNEIHLSHDLKGFLLKRGALVAGGTRGRVVADVVPVASELGRLLGYYIAEGTTDGKNSFSFTFSNDEKEYIDDLLNLVKIIFGLEKPRTYRRAGTRSVEIGFSSKIHAAWLAAVCYQNAVRRSAASKKVPEFLFEAPTNVQVEFLRGWYRGDKGYTSSRVLMNHIKTLCLQIGIIPSVIVDSAVAHAKRGNHEFGGRTIQARSDSFAFSDFAFFDDPYDLKKEIKRSQTKIDRRHGWIDKDYVYLPIKDISRKPYTGFVYNLEVTRDHSYVAEFAAVHNCWTPWFSVYGALGGFDSLDEAFGPYAKNIYAIETGLSSNPAMNWRIKELDNRAILSFSDAHSGPKLGREATVFDIPALTYKNIYQAIVEKSHIAYTIEFYPEEGKYHYTGHRTCGIRWSPQETKQKGKTCPVCGKPLTIGVLHRIEDLAGRTEKDLDLETVVLGGMLARATKSKTFSKRPPFVMLVPLQEIIAEAIGSPVASPKVQTPYFRLTDGLGGEFPVLLSSTVDDITHIAGGRVAQGIDRVRRGDISIDPGYDGVFGTVKIWAEGQDRLIDPSKEQLTMFS